MDVDQIAPTRRVGRFLVFLCIVGLSVGASASLWAQETGLINGSFQPFSLARSVATPLSLVSRATDPRLNELVELLRDPQKFRNKQTAPAPGSTQRSLAAVDPSSGGVEKQKLSATREALGSDLKVHVRSSAGTPRQIQGIGRTLQEFAPGLLPGPERDMTTAKTFLREKRQLLGIKDPENEFRLSRQLIDQQGRSHLRFSQIYRDLPVWPAEITVHLDSQGHVDLLDGAFVRTPRRLVTTPVIDGNDALALARREVVGGEDGRADEPLLIVYAPGDRESRLAWKVEIAISPVSHWRVVIDGLNGKPLVAYNTVTSENVVGTGTDLMGETRSLDVWQENTIYSLVDTSKLMYDPTSNPPSLKTTQGAIIVQDAVNLPATSSPQYLPELHDISSPAAASGWLADGVSAAFNLSETYDYFLETHGRDSMDGNGGGIYAVVRLALGYANAFYSSELNLMAFGDAAPYAGILDVVAHEYQHGVTSYTANLVYRNQSGALNEAYSDIFGEMVEARTFDTNNWQIGTDRFGNGLASPLRSMSEPTAIDIGGGFGPYPDSMALYINTSQDNGGVHLNSSIINHAYYLLAQGLDGAVGIATAEQIFFRALQYHLVANSQFIDARLACIASATELFPADPAVALKVGEAFDAVGILDDTATSDSSSQEPISGDDSVLFVQQSDYGYVLGRRESEQGDSTDGQQISYWQVAPSKVSVSGDGSMAVFVDDWDDFCMIATDGDGSSAQREICGEFYGWVHSVAMSPDHTLFSFVFQEDGEPIDQLVVIDLSKPDDDPDGIRIIDLVSPVLDSEISMNTIRYADAMAFSFDNRYIFYDTSLKAS